MSSSPLFTQQHVFADPPSAGIMDVISGGNSISPTNPILQLSPGDSEVAVTFHYRGLDDNDRLIEFRCSFDGGRTYSNCPADGTSTLRQVMATGDLRPRTYNFMSGSVTHNFPVGSHVFMVKVVNDNPYNPRNPNDPARISADTSESTWSFQVTAPPSSPPSGAPTISVRGVVDMEYNVDIAFSREALGTSSLWFTYSISPNVARVCIAPTIQGTPVNPGSLNYDTGCATTSMSTSLGMLVNLNNMQRNSFQTVCAIAKNAQNVQSSPACFTFYLRTADFYVPPVPIISAREPLSIGFNQVVSGDRTTSTVLNFYFTAEQANPSQPLKANCLWEVRGTYSPCGLPVIICNAPLRDASGNISPIRCWFEPNMLSDSVRSLSLGEHTLQVKARYPTGGYTPLPTTFTWCNVETSGSDCIGPYRSPISSPNIESSQYFMRTSQGLNTTTSAFTGKDITNGIIPDYKVLPYAGDDQTIYLNYTTNVELNGSLLVTPGDKILSKLYNNTGSQGSTKLVQETLSSPQFLKSIQDKLQDRLVSTKVKWSQMSGPQINLKDVDSWSTQFAVPSLKKDSQIQLKMEMIIDGDKMTNKTLSDTVNIFVTGQNTKN